MASENYTIELEGMVDTLECEKHDIEMERDALKAALRELVDAIIQDEEAMVVKEQEAAQIRHDAALIKAESLLNPIDYAAEKRADKAREMKQAMEEGRNE